jgi:hypothetical protein
MDSANRDKSNHVGHQTPLYFNVKSMSTKEGGNVFSSDKNIFFLASGKPLWSIMVWPDFVVQCAQLLWSGMAIFENQTI